MDIYGGERVLIKQGPQHYHFAGYNGEVIAIVKPGISPTMILRQMGLGKQIGMFYADSYDPEKECYLLKIEVNEGGNKQLFFVAMPAECLVQISSQTVSQQQDDDTPCLSL